MRALPVAAVGLLLVERVELGPRAALDVELLELGDGLFVAGRRLEQRLVGLDRVLHVGELLEPAPGDRAEELGLLLAVRHELGERDWCWSRSRQRPSAS